MLLVTRRLTKMMMKRQIITCSGGRYFCNSSSSSDMMSEGTFHDVANDTLERVAMAFEEVESEVGDHFDLIETVCILLLDNDTIKNDRIIKSFYMYTK